MATLLLMVNFKHALFFFLFFSKITIDTEMATLSKIAHYISWDSETKSKLIWEFPPKMHIWNQIHFQYFSKGKMLPICYNMHVILIEDEFNFGHILKFNVKSS